MLYEILCGVLAFLLLLYHYMVTKYNHHINKGLKFVPFSFPFGDLAGWYLLTGQANIFSIDSLIFGMDQFKKEKIVGTFTLGSPAVTVQDEELAKRILIKDFEYFVDKRFMLLEGHDRAAQINNNFLVNLEGDKWKMNRILLSGVFTSGKLKTMAPHIIKIGRNMQSYLDKIVPQSGRSEMMSGYDLAMNFTVDSIATSGYGLENNSFLDPDSHFNKMVRKLSERTPFFIFYFTLTNMFPFLKKFKDLEIFNKQSLAFLGDIVEKTYRHRIATGQKRNDIIDIMVNEMKKFEENQRNGFSKKKSHDEGEGDFERNGKLSDSDRAKALNSANSIDKDLTLVSNIVLFFVAGFDTTTNGLNYLIHFLINNPDVQDKVLDEVDSIVGSDGEVTFDKIQDMKYLDMVWQECSRRQRFITFLERLCVKDYKVPDTDYVIKKGTYVKLHLLPMATSSQNFAFPNEFNPDNFKSDNSPNKFAVPFFGQGPRNCIGMRYAVMTIKIGIVHLLQKYRLSKCSKSNTSSWINENNITFKEWFCLERRQ